MSRHELALLLSAAIVFLVVGLAWSFGKYALIGCGAILLIAAMFIDVQDGGDE